MAGDGAEGGFPNLMAFRARESAGGPAHSKTLARRTGWFRMRNAFRGAAGVEELARSLESESKGENFV